MTSATSTTTAADRDPGRRTVWAARLAVATGAGIATAHGLYQVAAAARVPTPIGWLYPLITDGLALVAYAATTRLHHGARSYAATIVVLAAGLSGLAQAVNLAGGLDHTSPAPVGLRFGVGAWPAIAAALTAHLLHLISTDSATGLADPTAAVEERPASNPPSNPGLSNAPPSPVVQPRPTGEGPARPVQPDPGPLLDAPSTDVDDARRQMPGGSARERAHAAARSHRDRHGTLPTVSELAQLARTSRGTPGSVIKDLRKQRALHVVTADHQNRTDQ